MNIVIVVYSKEVYQLISDTITLGNDITDLFFFISIEDLDFNDLILKKDFNNAIER